MRPYFLVAYNLLRLRIQQFRARGISIPRPSRCWAGTRRSWSGLPAGSGWGAGCIVKGQIPAGSPVTMSRELNIRPIQKGNT